MKLRSEKNLDGNQGRNFEARPASETLMEPFEEGKQTLILPDFEPARTLNGRELKERRRPRSVLFRGMSKSETKSNKWRK